MEEKKAKIVKINFLSEWAGPNGKVYYHDIELSNGDKGQIGAKDKLPEKLGIGAELTYTLEETSRGNKIKAVNNSGYKGNGRAVEDPRSKFIAFAHSYVKDLVVAGKLDLKDLNGGARSMFDNMIKLYDTIK